MNHAREFARCFFAGVRDSFLCFPSGLALIVKGDASAYASLVLLNGVFIYSMYFLFHALVFPLCAQYQATVGAQLGYLLFWSVPMYVLSLVTNFIWNSKIVGATLKSKEAGGASVSMGVLRVGVLVGLTCLLLTSDWVPLVGHLLYFGLNSWIYATCAFEVQWASRGRDYKASLQFFEKNWVYFCGWGSMLSLLSLWISPNFFCSYALISMYLPVLTASSIAVKVEDIPPQQLVPRFLLVAIIEQVINKPLSGLLLKKVQKRDRRVVTK